MDQYIAHPIKGREDHYLLEHLQSVAGIASQLAEPFGGQDLAYASGFTHDIGKATENFQNYLLADRHGYRKGKDFVTPGRHPRLGVVVLCQLLETQDWNPKVVQFVAYLVDHHHGGFYDLQDHYHHQNGGQKNFNDRLQISFKKQIEHVSYPTSIPGYNDICQKWVDEVEEYFHEINHDRLTKALQSSLPDDRDLAFFLRMVHSCLIEADRRDTALACDG